jgi:2-dehydro-3-deoxyphosphogluconate aldolase/(4S)-4-hydroxy-2-oxoglutarate aldolase
MIPPEAPLPSIPDPSTEALDRMARLAPVIPMLPVKGVEEALGIAGAFMEAGLEVMEITLRTPAALAAIEAIARAHPGMWIGAGTLVRSEQMTQAKDAGARFLVSPGFSLELIEAAAEAGLPYLPGVMTPSEIMAVQAAGLRRMKFFPSEAVGGVGMMRALAGPFPELRFCATGGIGREQVASYLALPNVACVGASWITPRDRVDARDWPAITEFARQAVAFGVPGRRCG